MLFAVSPQPESCCCCFCDSCWPKCGDCCVDIFGQKLLNVLCAKFCAKKKRVSSQLNKTIVKTIATIEDIATIVSMAKLLYTLRHIKTITQIGMKSALGKKLKKFSGRLTRFNTFFSLGCG